MITTEQNKFFDILETKNAPIDKWFKSLPFHGRVTGSNPVGSTIDNGFPHSTDVDNPKWNRNSSPCAEDLVKLKMHLRLERDGYSIIIKDIVLFP